MVAVMDAMVDRSRSVNGVPTSLADLGYSDVGLDDAWQRLNSGPGGVGYHDAQGRPIVNTTRFPSLRAMADHAHSLNLTSGWYSNNCISADPSANVTHFLGDVAAFREFGFDSYKLDSCGGQKDIALWSSLLASSGPAVLIENCHNGPYFPQHPYKPSQPVWCPFNLYRTSVDVEVLYASIFGVNLPSTVEFLRSNLSFPGCWAYPDMLEVGVTPGLHKGEVALTFAETRAHFAAWAIVSSPLVLSFDVRNGSAVDAMWPLVANTEILAVSDAWAGSAGDLILEASTNVTWAHCGTAPGVSPCRAAAWQVWSKPLPGGGAALLILNHNDAGSVSVSVPLAGIPGLACAPASCAVRDVYAHSNNGSATGVFTAAAVPAHDSVFVTLT